MATFGYTSIGASTTTLGSSGSGSVTNVGQFVAPENGTVTALNAYIANRGSANNAQLVMYADTGSNVPGNRLAFSSPFSVTSGAKTLYTQTVSVAITGGVLYWLGAVSDADFSGVGDDLACETTGGIEANKAIGYNPPTTPFGTPDATGVLKVSAFATYTPSGGSTGFNIALV